MHPILLCFPFISAYCEGYHEILGGMNLDKRFVNKVVMLLAGLVCSISSLFAGNIDWTVSASETDAAGVWELTCTGLMGEGIHSYPLSDPDSAPEIEYVTLDNCELVGGLADMSSVTMQGGHNLVFGKLVLVQKIRVADSSRPATVRGTFRTMCCEDTSCYPPEYQDFEISLMANLSAAADLVGNVEGGGSSSYPETDAASVAGKEAEIAGNGQTSAPFDWGLVLQAILWGFAMLLTPCVFPMIPMTVSFFLKNSGNARRGRFHAFMYGLFIVLLYTVPISLIILITWIAGGDAVTADIFNWLATHWLPNILFFVIFMVFAASFFGAFEITLPSSWVNKADGKSDKKGLIGVFFMALTLVLVSFSCTGPIVGTVLIQSTKGQFWMPIVTMLVFSLAFALPFTLFALFPSLLTKLRSGSWLGSVKVVLGFIEVALGFKFLSVADQTYHWGLLDREVYLAIWIVTFTLLGLYLLGKIRFAHDEKVEKLSVTRLALAIADFTFVVYMIPGMFGAPLKALSGYLPPISTQDFVLGAANAPFSEISKTSGTNSLYGERYDLHLPLGLDGYFTLEDGISAAKASGKPIFVDITGHGCVNCREMEARVWSEPRVRELLSKRFIIVALYVDDKTKLEESDWVYAENGTIYKEIGRANAYIARTRFSVNSQPNYILLDKNGRQIAPARGYDLDVQNFIEFLELAL